MRMKCWNTETTGGAFCIACGCCAKDPVERYESRVLVLEERIHELKTVLKDYQCDYYTTESGSKKFYSLVSIEKTEDQIKEYEALIRCYSKEARKLRKARE